MSVVDVKSRTYLKPDFSATRTDAAFSGSTLIATRVPIRLVRMTSQMSRTASTATPCPWVHRIGDGYVPRVDAVTVVWVVVDVSAQSPGHPHAESSLPSSGLGVSRKPIEVLDGAFEVAIAARQPAHRQVVLPCAVRCCICRRRGSEFDHHASHRRWDCERVCRLTV